MEVRVQDRSRWFHFDKLSTSDTIDEKHVNLLNRR